VSSQLLRNFADCLESQLASSSNGEAPAPVQKPVSGLSLGLSALGRSIARFFRGIVRRG
jgi:hypothetical protein